MPVEAAKYEHKPVLLQEVVTWLAPALARGTLIDCTVGGGGHCEALLDSVPDARALAIDRDTEGLAAAGARLERFGDRVRFAKANFDDLSELMETLGDEKAAAVLYDLGVSSSHLDDPRRGFGFRVDAVLDMRMDRSAGLTAEKVVNSYPEKRLAEIIAGYGEERYSRRIARAIVARRNQRPLTGTGELADVIRQAIPAPARRGLHPARRTFQALRIEVNQELDALRESLPVALDGVVPGGRVAVISYHSLEDRIVKTEFVERARGCRCPSDFPLCVCGRNATHRVLTRKPVRPSAEEVESNPRSRSARLRVAERLGDRGAA